MLLGQDFAHPGCIAFVERRQAAFVVILAVTVLARRPCLRGRA